MARTVVLSLALPVILFASLLLASTTASAFHCGTHLVHEGDTKGEVRAKCGEPTDIETRSILRRPYVWRHGRPIYVGPSLVEVPVEFWTYNLGPNKFMRRLRFEDGELMEIETLGYGYL